MSWNKFVNENETTAEAVRNNERREVEKLKGRLTGLNFSKYLLYLCMIYTLIVIGYSFKTTFIPAAVIGAEKAQSLLKEAKVKIGEFYENLNSSLNQ